MAEQNDTFICDKPQPPALEDILCDETADQVVISQHLFFNDSPCWEWVGYISSTAGYGLVFLTYPERRRTSAHRLFYEYFRGEIPRGYEVDHLCKVRHCCNPLHLEAVTVQENRRRRDSERTHCKHGHEFTPENTYLYKGTMRRCRACNNARQIAFHSKRLNLPSTKSLPFKRVRRDGGYVFIPVKAD